MFLNEYKPAWDELAPSLQYLFKNLETQIVDNYNKLQDILDKIGEVEKEINRVENMDQFAVLFRTGLQGQVVKVNQVDRKLYPNDEFYVTYVTDDLTAISNKLATDPTSDIISQIRSWNRLAHYNTEAISKINTLAIDATLMGGQNLEGEPYLTFLTGNGWSIDSTGKITCGQKSVVVTSLYSIDVSEQSFIEEWSIKANDLSTGHIGMLIGLTTDENGTQHTLSVIRSNRGTSTVCWAVVYDFGNTTQEILVDGSEQITDDALSGTIKLYVQKVENTFIIKSTVADSDEYVYTLDYTISVESGNEDQLRYPFISPNPIGFLVQNTTAEFSIVSDNVLMTSQTICSLQDNKHYSYNVSTHQWVNDGNIEDFFSQRIFMYNQELAELYFWYYPGTWSKMNMAPRAELNITNTPENYQVLKVDESGRGLIGDNELHIQNVVSSDADELATKNLCSNGEYVFNLANNTAQYKNGSNWVTDDMVFKACNDISYTLDNETTKPYLIYKTLVYNPRIEKLYFVDSPYRFALLDIYHA